jgi:hypothetical protein
MRLRAIARSRESAVKTVRRDGLPDDRSGRNGFVGARSKTQIAKKFLLRMMAYRFVHEVTAFY